MLVQTQIRNIRMFAPDAGSTPTTSGTDYQGTLGGEDFDTKGFGQALDNAATADPAQDAMSRAYEADRAADKAS